MSSLFIPLSKKLFRKADKTYIKNLDLLLSNLEHRLRDEEDIENEILKHVHEIKMLRQEINHGLNRHLSAAPVVNNEEWLI